MKLFEFINNLTSYLSIIYEEKEAKSLSNYYCKELLKINNTDFFFKLNEEISEKDFELLNINVGRLLNGEPLQYILGYSYFYGLKFIVSEAVLIPRQESEILVDFIIKKYSSINSLKILDICTGSGCLSVTLKKYLPTAQIFATDISKTAIEICKKNSELNNVELNIFENDILSNAELSFNQQFDLIISNPPYVLESEKKFMHKNVTEFEPEIALYVKDEEAFIFYEKISEIAKMLLKKNAELYFEINEKFASEVIAINEKNGIFNNQILKDFNGKNRFVYGKIKKN